MLVLTRKIGEVIAIGDKIRVTVVEVKAGQVRLGIEAPREMRILRQEIYEQVQKENKQAAQWDLTDLEQAATLIKSERKQ